MTVTAERLLDRPIIAPGMCPRMGSNINGPSLIRAPGWLDRPLGRYYLCFADHRGRYIRLAVADALTGPWRVVSGGCLDVAQTGFCTEQPVVPGSRPEWAASAGDWLYPHVASPDLHVEPEARRIRLYFHGLLPDGDQQTRVAVSSDGVNFAVREPLLGPCYMRVFQWGGVWGAIAMPNRLMRSPDGFTPFTNVAEILPRDTRHSAIMIRGARAHVFWTRIGDAPERIFHGVMDLTPDWEGWRVVDAAEVLRPERNWEGAALPRTRSKIGAIDGPANHLRDPCVFTVEGAAFLLYATAGESGIGIARIDGL